MSVHNHGIDPSCSERLVGECLLKPGVVVLDLDAIEVPEIVVSHLRGERCSSRAPGRLACPWAWAVADQIEAQTKPRRIPEPGLWAVVKADTKGRSGNGEHINIGAGWLAASDGKVRTWATLIDPTLVREGVSA